MKKLLVLVVVAALAYLWYQAHNYQPPPERHLAPVGTFYLTTYVSARTPTGIVGLTPGEEVRLVTGKTPPPNKRLVTDGTNEFEVDPSYLTDDIDIGQSLRSTDVDRQKSAAAAVIAEKAAADQAARKRQAELQKKAQEDLDQLKLKH